MRFCTRLGKLHLSLLISSRQREEHHDDMLQFFGGHLSASWLSDRKTSKLLQTSSSQFSSSCSPSFFSISDAFHKELSAQKLAQNVQHWKWPLSVYCQHSCYTKLPVITIKSYKKPIGLGNGSSFNTEYMEFTYKNEMAGGKAIVAVLQCCPEQAVRIQMTHKP